MGEKLWKKILADIYCIKMEILYKSFGRQRRINIKENGLLGFIFHNLYLY